MDNNGQKLEILIDAGTGGKDALLKAVEEAVLAGGSDAGGNEPISNYDALFDVLTEFGAGIRLVVDNAQNLDEAAKRVFHDAACSNPELEIVLN